jgi:hypothetical protein
LYVGVTVVELSAVLEIVRSENVVFEAEFKKVAEPEVPYVDVELGITVPFAMSSVITTAPGSPETPSTVV